MKTVLILVLSSQEPPYGQMIETSIQTWDSELIDGTTTRYYCQGAQHRHGERVWALSSPREDYDTIGYKNLLAFSKALEIPWDYMARVNSSCYVHKRRLRDYCQGIPETGLIRGILSDPHPFCGITRPFMWGGGQFIISRDAMGTMMENKHKWRHDLMEDVAMGEIAIECGLSLDSSGRMCSINPREAGGWSLVAYNGKPGFDFTDFSDVNKADDQHFFRVKHDPNRAVDAQLMRLLKEHLTP